MNAATITTAAGNLARLLASISDAEDRDDAIASVIRIIAGASESDAYTRLHDLAAEIAAQVERNREASDEEAADLARMSPAQRRRYLEA